MRPVGSDIAREAWKEGSTSARLTQGARKTLQRNQRRPSRTSPVVTITVAKRQAVISVQMDTGIITAAGLGAKCSVRPPPQWTTDQPRPLRKRYHGALLNRVEAPYPRVPLESVGVRRCVRTTRR